MLKQHLMAGLAATALMTAAAIAQTSPAPAPAGGQPAQTGGAAAASQLMAQMPPDMMRGSKLMGIDVYGSDNQKIGDIDEVILDRQGKIHGVVVGVGGFLGIGQKDVAIPYDQIQWMSNQEVQAQNNQGGGSGTNTAGGMTTASGGAAGGANQPATTGSTGGSGMAGGTTGAGGTTTAAGGSGSSDNMPARAMVKMTKADLQNAPEFRYSANQGGGGGAGGTNPPPASANRPGNAPAPQ